MMSANGVPASIGSMGKCHRTLPLLLVLLGCASPPAAQPRPPAQPEHLEIELDRPLPDEHIRQPSRLVEVSGRAGSLPFFGSDVVLLIDSSTVAVLSSGIDVDADGVVGRDRSSVTAWEPFSKPTRLWTTDEGDTLQALQLKIARDLVPRLSARQNRVGLASFTFRARTEGSSVVRLTGKPAVIVPVGAPAAVLEALENFPVASDRRWTDLSRLLERGAELLDEAAPWAEPARPRVILLLSLGAPSAPSGVYWSSQMAIDQAGELGEQGIEVWAIPFGGADPVFLSELTQVSGGYVLPLDRLNTQFGVSGPVELLPRELEIENVTNNVPATSLKVYPDGRFQAAVPLEPGPNTLEIRAVLADGRRTAIRRQVYYEVGANEPVEAGPADHYR
jgi:hypothetical protein